MEEDFRGQPREIEAKGVHPSNDNEPQNLPDADKVEMTETFDGMIMFCVFECRKINLLNSYHHFTVIIIL